MINKWIGIGRLTRQPDLRYSPEGKGRVNFNMAVQRPFKNQQGDRDADFINVVSFRNSENIANFTDKGSLVGVEGRLSTRSYENNEGKKVFVTEVVADSVQFLDKKGDSNQQPQNNQQQSQPQNNDPFANGTPIDISDDDLPF